MTEETTYNVKALQQCFAEGQAESLKQIEELGFHIAYEKFKELHPYDKKYETIEEYHRTNGRIMAFMSKMPQVQETPDGRARNYKFKK